MGGNAGGHRVGGGEPIAGERTPGAKLARQTGQEPGRTDVGEADADLGHRELKTIAGDTVRPMHRNADTAAHDDAVDQRDIGLGIMLDGGVEDVLLPPELQRLALAAGAAELVDVAQITTRRKRTPGRRHHDDPGHRIIVTPTLQRLRDRPHHRAGRGVRAAGRLSVMIPAVPHRSIRISGVRDHAASLYQRDDPRHASMTTSLPHDITARPPGSASRWNVCSFQAKRRH